MKVVFNCPSSSIQLYTYTYSFQQDKIFSLYDIPHCTMWIAQNCTLHMVDCTKLSRHCGMQNCTLHSVDCTKLTRHCGMQNSTTFLLKAQTQINSSRFQFADSYSRKFKLIQMATVSKGSKRIMGAFVFHQAQMFVLICSVIVLDTAENT